MSNDPDRAVINARITNIISDKSIGEDEKIRLIINIVDEITEELLSRGSDDDDEVEDHKDDEHDTLEDRINTLQQLNFLKA